MEEAIYERLRAFLERGEPVALATIVEVKGSVPRGVGTQMIVHPLSQHVGTVGGGCGEAETIRAGLDVIHTGRPTEVRVDLTEPISLEASGVCGGIYRVYIEPWSPTPENLALLQAWEEAIVRQRAIARLLIIHATGAYAQAHGARALVDTSGLVAGTLPLADLRPRVLADAQHALAEGRHRLLTYTTAAGDVHVFVEVHRPPPRLVIVGAGHIAVPLARMAHIHGFRVWVIDDRPSLATRKRFPEAAEIRVGPVETLVRDLETDEDTYIVLVTRGHQMDVACLIHLIDRPWAYLGMIGSRRRVRAVFQLLQEEKGIPAERLARVHAPIGLDIGAETPAEIATAILAEITLVRRGGSGRPLRDLKGAFARRSAGAPSPAEARARVRP